MNLYKTKLALAVFATAGLAACGGSSSGGGGSGGGGGGGGGLSGVTGNVTDLGGRGDWGSLVISGYGKVNNADSNNQTTTEAVPDGVTRWFGGTDNSDSSGTIEYVVLAETGEAFRPDEEVQGLTIEGAGSGTTINNVQITNSDDDGIEWFGGAANASNVVINGNSDDPLDQDLGWQGTIKKALVLLGSQHGDRGMETDNNGDDFAATPKTSPRIANVTILGQAGNGGASDANTMGALHREGYGGQVYRSVYADNSVNGGQFDLGCLDLDSEVDEDLVYGDVLFNCSAGALVSDTDNGASGQSYQEDFSNSGDYSVTENPTGFAIDNSTLAVTSNATTDANFDGPFTTPAGNSVTPDDYFGAVDPNAAEPFWAEWTIRDSDIEGNLPGNDFHPLEAEIGSAITAASGNECADKGNGLAEAGTTDVFGETFPVCVIRDGDLDGDYTLTNDHIYLLDGTVQVGNGDVEGASDPSTVREDVLTIEQGTQIMGVSNTDPSLVITRGSRIVAQGTQAQPIIFGAVDAN